MSMAWGWNDLPPEVLENVLACLPVHVLCRFRLVCKAWNHLITQPGFASLSALAPRQAPYVLITPKLVNLEQRRGIDLEILDLAEKRFYPLRYSFYEGYLRRSDKDFRYPRYQSCFEYTLAADKGLVYAVYANGDSRRHIVHNPLSKSFHHIPEPEFHFEYDRDIVVMAVDKATQSYQIVTMEAYDSTSARLEDVYLYDSTTVKWRKLCESPRPGYSACSSIFLNGVFYTLYVDFGSIPWWLTLYSCDLETGAWSYITVDLPQPSHPQEKSQLVVSLGRLFFVEYTGLPRGAFDRMTIWEELNNVGQVKKKHVMKVRISEILLAEKKVIKVAEMPKYSKYPRRMLDREHRSPMLLGNPVVAVGCGNSIVISSLFGTCVGWDLLKNCWHDLPTNTKHMNGISHRGVPDREGMYAGLVQLDMRKMKS